MASKYYGVDVGGQAPADVTVGSSTGSKDVELVVLDTNIPAASIDAKTVILEALEAIRLTVEQTDY